MSQERRKNIVNFKRTQKDPRRCIPVYIYIVHKVNNNKTKKKNKRTGLIYNSYKLKRRYCKRNIQIYSYFLYK